MTTDLESLPLALRGRSFSLLKGTFGMSQNNAPVKTFAHGTLRLSIWKNHNEGKAYYNAKLEHRYNKQKDPNLPAEWTGSQSIAYRDMPAAMALWQRAWAWINHEQSKRDN